jgi:hypothetical protein
VPLTFPVKITPVVVANNRPLRDATYFGPAFSISVPNNAAPLNLIFESAGYEPYTVERINPSSGDNYLVPPVPVTLTRIYGNNLTGVEVGERLRKMRDLTKLTGAVDILLYNVETFRDASRNKPDVLQAIEQFKAETKASEAFREFLTPEREGKMLQYRQLIEQERLTNSFGTLLEGLDRVPTTLDPEQLLLPRGVEQLLQPLDAEQLFRIIQEESDGPVVRAQAVRVFTRLERSPELNARALTYFRQQSSDTNAVMFAPALTALATIGLETDKKMVLESINSTDFYRAAAAINAVGNTALPGGNVALYILLKSKADESLKLEAIESLQGLALREDKFAAIALATVVSARNTESALIRSTAARALAGVQQSQEVRRALNDAARDESFDVRTSAAGAKNVKIQKGETITAGTNTMTRSNR